MNFEIPFVEMECTQMTKDGQAACGDDFQWERRENENRNIAVLSDGLGSGIKAHLLANMTTMMALRFVESNLPVLRAAETIMDSLPVCEIRKISYATFTIMDMLANPGTTRIIEMGNPAYIQLRGLLPIPAARSEKLVSERWPDRDMTISESTMMLGDRLIFCSDGVTQAGLGTGVYKFGWGRDGLLDFARNLISENPTISARELSRAIVFYAISLNRDRKCTDDTSCAVVYLRRPRTLRILTGPPFHKTDDAKFASMATSGADSYIVCGGTTANILERELRTTVEIDLKLVRVSGGLPPPGHMEGVGLVTEGILTLTKTAALLESHHWDDAPAAARMILSRIDDSDLIEFIVGTKVNEAHQDPSLPMDLEIRRNVVKRLKTVLEEQYRKKVTIQYI